jgi:hypothetical protein
MLYHYFSEMERFLMYHFNETLHISLDVVALSHQQQAHPISRRKSNAACEGQEQTEENYLFVLSDVVVTKEVQVLSRGVYIDVSQ